MHYDCAYMHSMSLKKTFNPPPPPKFIASCFPKVIPVQPFQTYSSNSHAAAGLLTHQWEGYYCKQSTPICVLSFCPFFPHLCVAALAAQHEYIFETQDQNDRIVEQ